MSRRSHHVLVAGDDQFVVHQIVSALEHRNYSIATAQTVVDAQQKLSAWTVDLLIAPDRLGIYTGIQLVLAARSLQPDIAALMVTGQDLRSLAMDAGRYRIALIQRPFDRAEFLMVAAEQIASIRRRQRWPRKVLNDHVQVITSSGWPGRLVDVSYGGFRMELSEREAAVPSHLLVDVPDFGMRVPAEIVWSSLGHDGASCVCGATVTDEPAALPSWCQFVDRVA
jgi:DNA-binding response OmpR family regulator